MPSSKQKLMRGRLHESGRERRRSMEKGIPCLHREGKIKKGETKIENQKEKKRNWGGQRVFKGALGKGRTRREIRKERVGRGKREKKRRTDEKRRGGRVAELLQMTTISGNGKGLQGGRNISCPTGGRKRKKHNWKKETYKGKSLSPLCRRQQTRGKGGVKN